MVEAVLDTDPLIHLDEIRQLDIFTGVFGNMYIPEYVVSEISNTAVHTFIQNNIDTIAVVKVSEQSIFSAKVATSGFSLNLADLAVIVVHGNNENAIAVTDDLELRNYTESVGKTVVGTVGVLFRAYKNGTLSEEELQYFVDMLFNDSSLYLSSAFKKRVLVLLDKCSNGL